MLQLFSRAVELLQAGELVAFPTETVYGLGADAANPQAVAKIFSAKGRPADHPLIVHLPGAGHLDQWARDIPSMAWALAEAFWPGPLTLILKRASQVPYAVTGGQETVGVRVPSHPVALELLRAYAQAGGGRNAMSGIAAPSANRFGRISPTTAQHVRDDLGDDVALIVDGGACDVGIESTIVAFVDGAPQLLRPGGIGEDALARVLGAPLPSPRNDAPRASGTLASHYAPRTPSRLVDAGALNGGGDVAVLARTVAPKSARWIAAPRDARAYAHELYANLRKLDAIGASAIPIEDEPQGEDWNAVRDRLLRATHGDDDDRD